MKEVDEVVLLPLSPAEFRPYRERLIEEYAEESAAAGRVPSAGARQWAEQETDRLLPHGIDTKDAYLLKIASRGQPGEILGYLWSARDPSHPDHAFIYDLEVLPEHRRRGIAAAAMRQLEGFLADRGYKAIGLHVYARNEIAHALYRKAGYQPVSHVLRKSLAAEAD